MKIIALLLLSLIVTTLAIDISFSKNVSWSQGKLNEFSYRKTKFTTLNLVAFNGAWYSSLEANAQEGKASARGIWGAIYTPKILFKFAPSANIAYFASSVDFEKNSDWLKWDVSASAGFLGSVYLSLAEKNSSGATVYLRKFKDLNWNINSSKSEYVKYVSFTAYDGGYSIVLSFIISDVVGVLKYGDAVVTPKSIESIIEIKGYPYKNPSNKLTLTLGVATGNFLFQSNGQVEAISTGAGEEQIYFSLSKTAVIGDGSASVEISSFIKADNIDSDDIIAQAKNKYKGSFSAHIIEVSFPPGAPNIIYDPTMGQGQIPQFEQNNTLMWVAIILGIVFVVAVAVVVVIIILKRRQHNYLTVK